MLIVSLTLKSLMHYLIHETANVSYLNDCHGVDITELV